jgi:hypothetical protein
MSKVFPQASAPENAEASKRIDAPSTAPAKSHRPVGSGEGTVRVAFAELHGRLVAVHCSILGREETVIGRGVYEQDADLGPVLRVDTPTSEHFQFTFAERTWDGEIVAGNNREWDFLIRLFR